MLGTDAKMVQVQNAAVLLIKLNNAQRRVIMELGHKF
jgi:hypothetical protein